MHVAPASYSSMSLRTFGASRNTSTQAGQLQEAFSTCSSVLHINLMARDPEERRYWQVCKHAHQSGQSRQDRTCGRGASGNFAARRLHADVRRAPACQSLTSVRSSDGLQPQVCNVPGCRSSPEASTCQNAPASLHRQHSSGRPTFASANMLLACSRASNAGDCLQHDIHAAGFTSVR